MAFAFVELKLAVEDAGFCLPLCQNVLCQIRQMIEIDPA
jgi:hypothetical protein